MSSQELRHAFSGVALAQRLDIFILYRGRHGKPPERLALTRPEIDALYAADLLELQKPHLATPDAARPFYRGFPVVLQGSK